MKTAELKATSNARNLQNVQVVCVCVFLALAVLIVFGQTAHFGFVNYDDQLYVSDNAKVTNGLSLQGVAWAFSHAACNFYHPLTMISLMLDYQLHGLHPGGYHLTNVLIHAASAILLFLIVRQMTGALWRSAFVAAVFAIHPLRVESVAWVSERKDVLATFFFMLTIGAYVHYARDPNSLGRYLMVAGLFVLGLLCKPTAVALPFGLLLLDYWPLNRFTPPTPTRATAPPIPQADYFGIPKRLILEKVPLVVLAAVACVVTYFAEGEVVMSIAKIPVPTRIGNVLLSYVVYLRQMVWPAGLAAFYPYPQKSPPLWEIGLAFLLLAGISGGVLAFWRKRPWLLAGWFWYLGMMVPVIGIVQLGVFAHADRNTYLPQIGLYVLLAWAVADWSAGWKHRRMVLGGLMMVVIGALTVCARIQTSYWRDSESLWARALACAPANILACRNLGAALVEHGKLDEAVTLYKRALEIKLDSAETHDSLGDALDKKGELNEAMEQYRIALAINPAYADAHYNLGNALVKCGNLEEAVAHYRKVLEINPDYLDARMNLGLALAKSGQMAEAIAQYQKTLEINPRYAKAHCNLGDALLQQGHADEAVACFQRALEIQPDYAKAHYDLANVFFDQGHLDQAIAHYQKALEADPALVEAHFNLGNAFLNSGRFDEAVAHYKKVLELHPGYGGALNNLGTAYNQLGRVSEAIGAYRKALDLQPENTDALNNLAWALATCPQAALRDGAAALALAKKAGQLTGEKNPLLLRTLAAAYAETGSYGLAAVTARRAMELAVEQNNDKLAAALQKEIKLYEADTPVRESTMEGSEMARPMEAPQRGEPTARDVTQ